MRPFVCLVGLSLVLLVGSPPIGAQETIPSSEAPAESVDCVDPDFLSNALIECAGPEAVAPLEEADADIIGSEIEAAAGTASVASSALEAVVFPSYCRLKVDAIFWGGRQWLELAQGIAGDYSQCAEYYISIPPQDDDATMLRPRRRFEEMRLLDRIHPVAEIRYTAPNRPDWREWALARGGDLEDFYAAGVEARRRMAQRGLDVTAGETWAFNELTEEVLENVPGWRAQVLEFLRGLYDGAPGMPKARGIVFNVGIPSDADDVAAYKASLQEWLTDEAFWSDMDTYVEFFAHEVYASVLTWGVAGVPLARRAEYLNDYFQHVTALAEAGPDSVQAARSFLRRAYLPLGNAGWPSAVLGNTDLISADTMGHFVSTQVYAVRHYANSHPQTAPRGRIGFGWAPMANDPRYLEAGRNLILGRLASAIHEASEEGTNSQMGACGVPGEHVWCEGEVEGATLNDAWKIFASWD